jgi:hypothetical protein
MEITRVKPIYLFNHFKTKIIHKEALLVQAGAAMDVNEVVHRIFNNNNLNKRELIQSYNNIKVSIKVSLSLDQRKKPQQAKLEQMKTAEIAHRVKTHFKMKLQEVTTY